MKAVILAAGRGTRMRPLTDDTPKPMLPVAGKPVMKHSIDLLEDLVDEVIVVAGHMKEQIEKDLDVTVVEQEEALGTGHAALQAREHVDGPAVILNGDDIYGEELREAVEKDSAIMVHSVDDPSDYGVVETREGTVEDLVEKPGDPSTDLANTGVYVVKERFFDLLEDLEKSERGEYEITDAVRKYAEDEELEAVEAETWLPCNYPWELLEANRKLLEPERLIEGDVDPSARVNGDVVVEEGAVVREYSVIEGPAVIRKGCDIGPHAHIRGPVVLEENVHVGSSEVKSSVIREGSNVPHQNYVGNSYVGKDVNMGAGSKTANLLNDGSTVRMEVKGELVDTGRRKMGAVIGSGASIGVNSSIKPGRKIGLNASTDVGEKVSRTLPQNSVLKDGEIVENRD